MGRSDSHSSDVRQIMSVDPCSGWPAKESWQHKAIKHESNGFQQAQHPIGKYHGGPGRCFAATSSKQSNLVPRRATKRIFTWRTRFVPGYAQNSPKSLRQGHQDHYISLLVWGRYAETFVGVFKYLGGLTILMFSQRSLDSVCTWPSPFSTLPG